VLGIEPYFDQPFYVGFNVGGFELGLHPRTRRTRRRGGRRLVLGRRADDGGVAALMSLGATAASAPQDVGEGIQVATVRDPFGNLLGIIENPHFPNTA
jgi:hypothetical protein